MVNNIGISVEQFFDLLIEELKSNGNIFKDYYKFLDGEKSFEFRKAYFCQRLQYIADNIGENKSQVIYDIGCGYATTAIFLVLNGYTVHGTTLEFYYDKIKNRIAYYEKHGSLANLHISYENIYDQCPDANSVDTFIVQDTLHHLEPLPNALNIFHKCLSANGKLIAIEENGDNVFIRMKNYKLRGNKRIINYYDEKLKKHLPMGNENVRGMKLWGKEFDLQKFNINPSSINYVRFYWPFYYANKSPQDVIAKEQALWKKNIFYKKYFFFGINFIAYKK